MRRLIVWARTRGIALSNHDGTLGAGTVLFLSEPLSARFALAAALIAAGIALVNFRR